MVGIRFTNHRSVRHRHHSGHGDAEPARSIAHQLFRPRVDVRVGLVHQACAGVTEAAAALRGAHPSAIVAVEPDGDGAVAVVGVSDDHRRLCVVAEAHIGGGEAERCLATLRISRYGQAVRRVIEVRVAAEKDGVVDRRPVLADPAADVGRFVAAGDLAGNDGAVAQVSLL